MPSIEGRVAERRILLRLAIAPTDPTAAQPSFPSHFETCFGVLDTGAMTTAVSNRLVSALQLRPMGRKPVVSAAGSNMHNLHTFRLGFHIDREDGAPSFPHFLERTIEGMNWTDHPIFDVLIGMDVIGLCDLSIRRNGSFQLDVP
jgi:hypothetical protein